MVALYWITSCKGEWKQFVQNRVVEIQKLIPIASWRHCKGTSNPADLPSRGATPAELIANPFWFEGPPWLYFEEEESIVELTPPEGSLDELKKTSILFTSNQIIVDTVIDCKKFSSLYRLLRVTAYVLKFVKLLKSPQMSPRLTTTDIQEAHIYLIKVSQQFLPAERAFKMWCPQFDLFLDVNGVWKCGGRLGNADIPESTSNPILLDTSHHLTTLIVKHCHEQVKHGGVTETLAQLRSKYWIIRGRSFVRRFIHSCVVCRRIDGTPYNPPRPPALPESRVKESPPFTFTGIDFAGPLYLRDSDEKLWICLFTCAVVRAVHLEVVTSLSAQSFIRCFSRFVSRRGLPSMLITDNAKTFKSAKQILKSTLDDPTVQGYLLNHQVQWNFNLERAPWWGGFFERLIGLMKRHLKKSIGQARMSYDEMLTLVVEVEAILNSRPLTYISTEETMEPLTPSHLITGQRLLTLPKLGTYKGSSEDSEFQPNPSCQDLNKRLVYLNRVVDQFWTRWRREYLVSLRDSHRQRRSPGEGSSIDVGDICVLFDPSCPRTFWKLAQVNDLIVGQDGQVRGAVVRTTSKGGSVSILRRPLQHLYPLEIHSNDATNEYTTVGVSKSSGSVRPVRAAARLARERLKIYNEELM